MPRQNRVAPDGRIIATEARGLFLGNRGIIHGADGAIVRTHAHRAWIICLLSFKDRRRALMQPGRWTELFFLDEATALAAGHRPCAECQRPRFSQFRDAWVAAFGGEKPRAPEMDLRLHAERMGSKPEVALGDLPPGAMVQVEGEPFLVMEDRLLRWTPAAYVGAESWNAAQRVRLLTPPATVEVLRAGYQPGLHPTLIDGE
jgi:hypothetical protein